MNQKLNFKHLVLVVVLLALTLTLFVACGEESRTTFTPVEDPGTVTTPTDTTGVVSTVTMSGYEALQMMYDAMEASAAQGKIGNKYMNFAFSTFFILEREEFSKYYYIDVKGALNTEDATKSLFSLELREVSTDGAEKLLIGFYEMGETLYIDLRGVATTQGVHVLSTSALDLEWLAQSLQGVFDGLDLGGFLGEYKIKELLSGKLTGTLGTVVGSILGDTIANTIQFLTGDDATVTTYEDGRQDLYVPLSTLNGLLPTVLGMLPALLGDTIGDVYELAEMLFGWDLASVLNSIGKETQVQLVIESTIIDGMFYGMDVKVDIDSANPLNIYLGANNFAIGSVPNFDMPDFTNVEVEEYSLTTINADVELRIDAKANTYYISETDPLLGGLLSSLVEDLTSLAPLSDMPINIAEDTTFLLHLKIRAEIDLRDNNNTNGVVEIRGGLDDTLRAALYYVGADEALYIDLSGMGGGRYKIDSYVKTTTTDTMVEDANGEYACVGLGYYSLYDSAKHGGLTRYKKVSETTYSTESINLTKIIKDAIDGLIAKVPSIVALITGYDEYIPATGETDVMSEIFAAYQSGSVLIPHYGTADAAATVTTEIDTMALIKQILSCVSIDRGSSKYSFDSITIDLTQEVIHTIFELIKPGLTLPITELSVYIGSENAFGIKSIVIDAALGTDETPDLIALSVPITLEWGRHLEDWEFPNFNDANNPYVPLSITRDSEGNLQGITTISLSLDGYLRLQMGESLWDLSELQTLIYGLLLKMQVTENIDAYFGFTIQANLDISNITADDFDILSALDAKICIIKDPDSNSIPSIIIYLTDGMLYVDAEALGIPLVKINIAALTDGSTDFASLLLTKDPYATSGTALATEGENTLPDTDLTPEESETDAIAIVAALISGVSISSTALEVALATNLISELINAIDPTMLNSYALVTEETPVQEVYYVEVGTEFEVYDPTNAEHAGVLKYYIDLTNAGTYTAAPLTAVTLAEGTATYAYVNGSYVAFNETTHANLVKYYDDNGVYKRVSQPTVDAGTVLYVNDGVSFVVYDSANAAYNNLTIYYVNLTNVYSYTIKLTEIDPADTTVYYVASAGKKIVYDSANQLHTLLPKFYNTDQLRNFVSNFALDDESGIAINFDGINLSELYISANIAIANTDNLDNNLSLGLGLGHILIGLEALDLAPVNEDDYADVLTDLQVYLALQMSITLEMLQNEINIDTMLGAILGDLMLGVSVEEDINPGLVLNLQASVDLATIADYNETQIKLEITGYQSGKILIGAYYSNGKLYVDVSKIGIDKFYIGLDIMDLISNAISAAGMATAAADVDLSSLSPLILLSSKNLQIKLATGLTAFLLTLIADSISGTDANAAVIDLLKNQNGKLENLNIPEIGAEVEIRWSDGQGTPLLNALAVGIDIYALNKKNQRTVAIAIDLGGLELGFKTRELLKGINLTQFSYVPLLGVGEDSEIEFNLDNIYAEVTGYISLAAFESNPEETYACLGDYLTQFFYEEAAEGGYVIVNGKYVEYDSNNTAHAGLTRYNVNYGENTAIMQLLSEIILSFQVLDDVEKYLGFRIAANLAIDPLINPEYVEDDAEGDKVLIGGEYVDYDETNEAHTGLQRYSSTTLQVILEESELALEIYNGLYAANNDPIISVYLQSGVLYIRLNGKMATNVRLKLDLVNLIFEDSTGTALSTADGDETFTGVIPENILDILNGALAGITLNSQALDINIGSNLIGAVLGLIPAVSEAVNGADPTMPQLNEENSKLSLGLVNDKLQLSLSIGIDPIAIGIVINGFRLGFSDGDVFPISEESLFESGYKSLGQLTTLSLQASLGLNIALYESEIPLGDILACFIADLALSLGITIEDDLSVGIEINLAANIDITDAYKTEISLEMNTTGENGKRILGVYVEGDCIYANFEALNVAPFMVSDLGLVEGVLSSAFASLVDLLGSLEASGYSSALATADGEISQDVLEILFSLAENSVKLNLSTSIIVGLLAALLPDVFTAEVITLFEEELKPELNLELDTSEFIIDVSIDTEYLSLGVWVGKPVLGTSFIDGILAPVTSNRAIYTDFRDEDSVFIEIDLALRYRLFETSTDLDCLLEDLAALDFGSTVINEDYTVADLLRSILIKLAITDDAMGEIGLRLMATLDVGNLIENADNIDILSALEIGLEVSLGSKKVYVMLMGYDATGTGEESAYLFVNLEQIGAPNFRLDLGSLINSASATSYAYSTADGEEEGESDTDVMAIISSVLQGTYVGIGKRGLAVNLAYDMIGKLLKDLLTDFTLSDETLSKLNFVNEATEDSAYMLTTEATDEDIMDNREYVKINGQYVVYDEGNIVHQAEVNRYYKVRSTSITFKTRDPKNENKPSVNIDFALGLGLDFGISIYGYRFAVSTDNLILPLGDLSSYPNIANITNETVFVSLTVYLELAALEDATYQINSILDVFLGDVEAAAGLTDMLLAIALDKFQNRIELRISANIKIADFMGETMDLSTFEGALELIHTEDDGTVDVLGGIYLIDGNAYIDIRRYNDAPIIYILDFSASLVRIIGELTAEDAESTAISTESAAEAAGTDEKLHVADIVLGTAGLGLIGYSDLITAVLNIFGYALGLEDIFGNIGLSVMLNYAGAKSLRDISLDVDVNIGALNIGLGVQNIELGINSEKEIIDEDFIFEAINIEELPFSVEAKLSIKVAVNNGKVDIGALLADYIPNLSLEVNVPEEEGAFMQIDIILGAIVNLSNFNTLEIMAKIYLQGVTTSTLLIGAYYTEGVFYVDASGIGVEKVKMTGMDIGSLLEDAFGASLGHDTGEGASAAALDSSDRSLAALLLLLDGKRVSIQIGTALIDWILNMEAINIGQYIPAGMDISAFVDVNYINNESGKFDISLDLGVEIAEMVGLYISLYDLGIGMTDKNMFDITDPYDYVEILEFNSPVLDELGNKTYDAETGELITETAVVLEHVALELNIDIYSLMCGDEDGVLDFSDILRPFLSSLAEDLVTQFQFPEGAVLNNFNINIVVDAQLMQLIEVLKAETIDIGAVLNLIDLSLEIRDTTGGDNRLILGVYLIDGAVSLYLEGLGFPNITVSNAFITKLINKLTAEGSASAIATADEEEDSTSETLATVGNIINSLVKGIEITGKTVIIVIENTYMTELFNLVFPEMAIEAPSFDIGRNALALNFNRGYYVLVSDATEIELFYEDGNEYVYTTEGYVVYQEGVHDPEADRYYYIERNGLVELDLTFYTSLLGIYIQPPAIMLSPANIELPNVEWTNADEVRGVSIELRGRLGGSSSGEANATLGEILNGVLGDLSTKLIFDDMNIDISFSIEAYLGFEYDIDAGTFDITELDLAIKLLRNNAGTTVTQAAIYYSNTRGTIYVDLSYYGLPKISVDGIKLSEILGELLSGEDETEAESSGDALSTNGATAAVDKATPGIFTDAATIYALLSQNTLMIGLSSKIINALITLIAGNDEISQYLPNLGLEVGIEINPFILSLIIQLQNGEYEKLIDIFVEFYGFDHDEWAVIDPDNENLVAEGSDLDFYAAGEYTGGYIDIDTSIFTNILTLDLDADTEIGEEVANLNIETLAVSATVSIELTAKNIHDWAEYFTSIFGLSEDEMNLWIAILDSMGNAGTSTSVVTISIDANINIAGITCTPMSLKGTEARITINFVSTVLANAVSEGSIVITVIGENASGMSEIYLDLSNYRGKGRHKIELDLAGIISGLGSAATSAFATGEGDEVNTGMLPANIYTILDSMIDYVKIENNKISIGVKDTIISALFDLLLSDNPNFEQGMDMPLVEGELSITLTNWDIALNLSFDNGDMAIGLRVTGVNIGTTAIEAVAGSGSLLPEGAEDFGNLFEGQLLIELLGVLDFEASETSLANPALDLSQIFGLITNDEGVSMVQNPLFQVRIANDIDKQYIVDTQIFVDLGDFNNMKIAIAIFDSIDEKNNNNPLIGIYIDGHDAYLDLSFLGIPKMKIEGLNLGDIINDALESTGLFSADAAASYNDFVLSGNLLPYAALVFMPEKFAVGLNAKIIDAIYKIVLKSQGNEVEEGITLIPDFGDLALLVDSTTTYVLESEATAEQITEAEGVRYVYDTALVKYVRVTTANEAAYVGYDRYVATGGKPLPELAIKMGDSLYLSLRLRDITVDGSNYQDGVTFGSFSGFDYMTVAEKTEKTVYNGFMDYVYDNADEYETLYKFENGLQALLDGDTFDLGGLQVDEIAIGFDVVFNLSTKDVDVVGAGDHSNSLQYYLSCLLSSLLGSNANMFNFTAAANTNISYTLSVKLVVKLSSLITSSGINFAGLLDAEMAIEIIIGAPYNKLVIGLYKKQGDDVVYADLSGLGLPKVKLFGLGSLLKSLATGASVASSELTAMSTAAEAAADDNTAELAFAEIVLDDGFISINIEPEFIYQILKYAGYEIVNYTVEGVDLYKGIEFVEADGTVVIVPLPDAQSISLNIEIPGKLEAISIDVLADKVGTKLSLAIRNFDITFDAENFITDAELPSDTDDYGALFLGGADGISLRNLMASLLDGLNANLSIALNKNTGDENTWLDISVVTTTPTSTSVNGYLTGANKIMATIKTNQDVNVSAFIFNNKISADLSDILSSDEIFGWLVEGIIKLIGDGGIMEFTDLNIVSLISGAATAVADIIEPVSEAVNGMAASTETATAAGLMDGFTIKDIIKGISIDWWNGCLHSNLTPSQRYSSIRVDLNYEFVNRLMMMINFLMAGLFSEISEEDKAVFNALTYDEQYAVFVSGATPTNYGLSSSFPSNLYSNLPETFVQFIKDMLSELAGSDAVGTLMGLVNTTLNHLSYCLLPFPILTADDPCYIDITLDKGLTGTSEMNLIAEIGIYLGEEKGQSHVYNSGSDVSIDNNSVSIIINNNGLEVKSAVSWDWYTDTEETQAKVMFASDYTINDAFDPWEISDSSLSDGTRLPQRAYVEFTDGTNSKTSVVSGSGDTVEALTLAGTYIIWDTSSIDLTPGATSVIRGYALNKLVKELKVTVGNTTAYRSIYGYVDKNGNFIRSSKLILDPLGATANSVTTLPDTIVIVLNNGNLQVLNTGYSGAGGANYKEDEDGAYVYFNNAFVAYDANNTEHAELTRYNAAYNIYGVTDKIKTKYGKLTWLNSTTDYANSASGDYDISFYYQVNTSAKITIDTTVGYTNRKVQSIILPNEEKYNILEGTTTLDVLSLTEETYDIAANLAALTEVDVQFTDGSVGTISVVWDLDQLNNRYNKNKAYLGVEAVVGATVGVEEGIEQVINLNIDIEPKTLLNITKVDMATPSFTYNPYDEYTGDSIALTDGNKLNVDMNINGATITVLTPVTLLLPAINTVNLSYNDGDAFIATVQVGGVEVNGEIIGAQTAKVRVYVEKMVAKTANIRITDTWSVAQISTGNTEVDVTSIVGQEVQVVFADNSTNMLTVKKLTILAGQQITNKGGAFTARVVVGNANETINDQTLEVTIIVPRKMVVSATADINRNNPNSTNTVSVTYTNGQTTSVTSYNVTWPANIADLITGDTASIPVTIGSEEVTVTASVYTGAFGSRGYTLAPAVMADESDEDGFATAAADAFVVEYIVEASYRSITVDPMTDSEITYPSQVWVKIEGVTDPVLMDSAFFQLDPNNPEAALQWYTFDEIYGNKQYVGGDYPDALVKLTYGADFIYYNVPVKVLNREIESEEIKPSYNFVNPFAYNAEPSSLNFSYDKNVLVTYVGGDAITYPVIWSNIDVTYTVEKGITFVAVAQIGEGMATFKKDVSVTIRPYIITAEKLNSATTSGTLQSELSAKVFNAYNITNATNPMRVENYPETCIVMINNKQVELETYWDVDNLEYNYEGGAAISITCSVGTARNGYQDVDLSIDIQGYIVESVAFAADSNFNIINNGGVYTCAGIDLLNVGKNAPNIATANVTYTNGSVINETIIWDMSKVTNVANGLKISGGTFTVNAVIRGSELAGSQEIPVECTYLDRSVVTSVTRTDNSVVFSNTVIDPYNTTTILTPEFLKVTFSGGTVVTFGTRDSTNKLVWNKANFNLAYNSSNCYITAKFYANGISFDKVYNFTVTNLNVSSISFDSSTFYSVTDGLANYTINIDPYVPSQYTISSSVYVVFHEYRYHDTLADTYLGTNGTLVIDGSNNYTYTAKGGAVYTGVLTVDGSTYSLIVNSITYSFGFTSGDKALSITGLGVFSRDSYDAGVYNSGATYSFEAVVTYSGGYKIKASGGTYSATFKIGNNEAITIPIVVADRTLYTTSAGAGTQTTPTEEQLKTAVGFTPAETYAVSGTGVALPLSVNMYFKDSSTVSSIGVYWKIIKTYNANEELTKNVRVYSGYDFGGTVTAASRIVSYYTDTITSVTSRTSPLTSSYTLDLSIPCKYELVAYIGRAYEGTTLKLEHQYEIHYATITVGGFSSTAVSSTFFGAWRSSDLNYNYVIFDNTNTGTMHVNVGGTVASGTVTSFDGIFAYYTVGGISYTATLTEQGITVVGNGTTTYYVKYDFLAG